MFTGIIETLGTIVAVEGHGQDGARIGVRAKLAGDGRPAVALGDSVAVNGVCLTAVAMAQRGASVEVAFDVSHETMARTGFGALRRGDRVNIERALRLGDRLGGHWVTGHVDGLGTLDAIEARADATDLRYAVPAALEPEVVEKGSIAIDGVSLTVNEVWPGGLRVTIIPHTAQWTQLLDGGQGKRVHLETDIIAKHIRRLATFAAAPTAASPASVDLELLRRAGFA